MANNERVGDGNSKTSSPLQLIHPDIPTEIHLAIADYLSLSSLCALILTTKRFLHIHGTKHWTAVNSDPKERGIFLLLLERDLEDYYYSKPLLQQRAPELTPRDYKDTEVHGSHYNTLSKTFGHTITWPHLILALKHDLYGGNHGLPLSVFTHSTSAKITSPLYPYDVYVINLQTDPTITTGRLLLRCEYRIPNAGFYLSKPVNLAQLKDLDLMFCNHLGTASRSSPWYDNSLATRLLPPRYKSDSDSDGGGEETLDELYEPRRDEGPITGNCAFCMTDYEVASSEHFYIVTTWQNLGDGSSSPQALHARDPEQNLVWKAFTGGGPNCKRWTCMLKYPAGCIRDAYEKEDGRDLPRIETKL